MDRDDMGRLLAATSAEIDAMDWQAEERGSGVKYKVLWQSGRTVLGVMRIEPGAENPEHTHHGAHHHIVILNGECSIAGRHLDAQSYIYIPPGVAHGVSDVGEDGVEFFYTYRPVEVEQPGPDYSAPV
ncbi:MAG: cupin domain-containing protein [Actinobacteria bacterium]|nr:cupin domain-containing protein [Actinomycetota bacterium]